MKNNLFKKVSAAVLAGLMVLTFAPAASLDVFAAAAVNQYKDGKLIWSGTSVTPAVVTDGTWTVTGAAIGDTLDSLTVSGANITLSLDGTNITTLTVASGSSVTIKGTTDDKGDPKPISIGAIKIQAGSNNRKDGNSVTIDAPGLTVGDVNTGSGIACDYNSVDFKSVKYVDKAALNGLKALFDGTSAGKLTFEAGCYGFNPAQVFRIKGGTGAKDTIGSRPVAEVKDTTHYYISNDAINKAEKADETTGNVVAYNGAVEVKELKSGNLAYVDVAKARPGTTIKATAAEKTSLVTAKTVYNYTFKVERVNELGTTSYTDNVYGAGKAALDKVQTLITTTGAIYEKNTNGTTRGAGVKTPDLRVNTNGIHKGQYKFDEVLAFTYDRAITLDEAKGDEFDAGTAVIDSYDCDDYTSDRDGHGTPAGAKGITYFTKDYSALAPENSGVAVIDDGKYIINSVAYDGDKHQGQLAYASKSAAKSIKVLTGSSLTTGLAEDADDVVFPGADVEVSAPATSSVVITDYTTIGTKVNPTDRVGYIYGVNQDRIKGREIKDSIAVSNKAVDYAIEVPQVAKNHVAGIVYFDDAKVTPGTGITYFKNQRTGDLSEAQAHYYFGTVADATKGLEAVLSGTTTSDKAISWYATALAGDKVYVAKDIKGTFKNVNTKVEVTGEISQDSTKQADGKYTWHINEGYATESVPAYRMYRKSGEHVYTISAEERDMLVSAGWINEGVAFKVNSVVSKKGTPVYRVYNKNNGGMHFYTASAAEKDMLLANGWTEGAVVFYGADKATGIPVYRTYNTGSNNGEHNYTTNIAESDMNVKAGWRAEGVAFYVFK